MCFAALGAIGSRISRSTEPGSWRPRFATFVLQLVQLLFQIRFALLQILQLAIPVINVRDVVLHPGCHVKASAAVLLDVVLHARNRLVHGGDLAQDLLRAPAPVLFAVLSPISTRIRWPRAPRAFLWRLANHGYAGAFQSRQIILGIHLALRHSRLFCFGFARRFRRRIFFLPRLVWGCGLSLGQRLSLGRRWWR